MNRTMKSYLWIVTLLGAASLLTGCAASGLTASSHLTNVELSDGNYRVVATNITGQASSKGIVGISVGFGMGGSQMSLIPLTEDRMLYKRAMQDLWNNFEERHGAPANRRLALVNVRFDSESLNLLLYTRLNTVIIADVVEFD